MDKPYEIVLDTSDEQAKVAKAITDFLDLTRNSKELEKKASISKKVIETFAEKRWTDLYASTATLPPTPFRLVTESGKSVNYVVQDRTEDCVLKPETATTLCSLLGDDEAAELIRHESPLIIDAEVLREAATDGRPIQEIVGPRLQALFRRLAGSGIITAEQAQRIYRAVPRQVLKPGLLDRLPGLVGKAADRLADVLGALSSSVVRYVKG